MPAIVVIEALVVTTIIVNFFYIVFHEYYSGCSLPVTDPRFMSPDCGMLLLPATACLRPFLLLFRQKAVMDSLVSISATMFFARNV